MGNMGWKLTSGIFDFDKHGHFSKGVHIFGQGGGGGEGHGYLSEESKLVM